MAKKIIKKPVKRKVVVKSTVKLPNNWKPEMIKGEKLGRGFGTGGGRFKKIESPEKLWQLFLEYRQWSIDNPYKKHIGFKGAGKNEVKVYEDRQRALTFIGFEGWLSMNEIISCLSDYEKGTYPDYSPVIKAIRHECKMETVGGALSGIYNANLAARLEGLVEKQDITSNNAPIAAPIITVVNTGVKLANNEADVDTGKKK